MGRFYGMRIINEVINHKTGAAWTINDVPALWRDATEAWLANN